MGSGIRSGQKIQRVIIPVKYQFCNLGLILAPAYRDLI